VTGEGSIKIKEKLTLIIKQWSFGNFVIMLVFLRVSSHAEEERF